MTAVCFAASQTATRRATGDPSSVAVGYLRAFITLLVVAHHAVLAYHPFVPPGTAFGRESPWWRAFPVVDSQKSMGVALFAAANDVFFMSLMFFLSGLFVYESIERKGTSGFLRGRTLRLGIPFVVSAAVLAPLAYFPSYLASTPSPSLTEYARQWLSLGDWPAGPAWFLWVLLAFDGVAVALTFAAPRWGTALSRFAAGAREKPTRFFAGILAVTALAYIPMAIVFNPLAWANFGPFTFQSSRPLLYLAWFLAGAAVGAFGLSRGLLSATGKLARNWPVWTGFSLLVFAVHVIASLSVAALPPTRGILATTGLTFVLSCAGFCFSALAIFVRFFGRANCMLENLRVNAYGIYIVHYVVVSWLQYAFLFVPMPALAKAVLVTVGAVLISWGIAAQIRRVPSVARVL